MIRVDWEDGTGWACLELPSGSTIFAGIVNACGVGEGTVLLRRTAARALLTGGH